MLVFCISSEELRTSEPKANDKYINLNILRTVLFTQCFIYVFSVHATSQSLTNRPANQLTYVENNRNKYQCNKSPATIECHTHLYTIRNRIKQKKIKQIWCFCLWSFKGMPWLCLSDNLNYLIVKVFTDNKMHTQNIAEH